MTVKIKARNNTSKEFEVIIPCSHMMDQSISLSAARTSHLNRLTSTAACLAVSGALTIFRPGGESFLDKSVISAPSGVRNVPLMMKIRCYEGKRSHRNPTWMQASCSASGKVDSKLHGCSFLATWVVPFTS